MQLTMQLKRSFQKKLSAPNVRDALEMHVGRSLVRYFK
jgi:hypothetical protein